MLSFFSYISECFMIRCYANTALLKMEVHIPLYFKISLIVTEIVGNMTLHDPVY